LTGKNEIFRIESKRSTEMKINIELKEYITKNIFPFYTQVDEGHNLENHILPVIEESIALAESQKDDTIDLNIVYTTAAYHDIGLIKERKNHHYYSREFVLADENLNRWFTREQIRTIAEAVFDHRASKRETPRSIYGKIVADSDKNVDLYQILMRTHLCIKTKYPNENLETFEKEFEKAYEWVMEKDSKEGYLKFYINKEKDEKLETLHHQVKNKTLVKELYRSVWKK